MIGIYKITSPTNKIYIGQSVDIEKRFNQYKTLNNCKSQPALYRSLLKYGFEKHKFEILCECNIEELNDKERYYQDIFSVIGKNGLNCRLTKSSDRSGKCSKETKLKISLSNTGKKRTEEQKQKMSEAKKGNKYSLGFKRGKPSDETKLKIGLGNKGKKHSDESKKKISEANKGNKHTLGRKLTDEHKKKIRDFQYNLPDHMKIARELKKIKTQEKRKNKQKKMQPDYVHFLKRIVLNTQTGVFYYSVVEAAESINMNKHTLGCELRGYNKPKTPFIYV